MLVILDNYLIDIFKNHYYHIIFSKRHLLLLINFALVKIHPNFNIILKQKLAIFYFIFELFYLINTNIKKLLMRSLFKYHWLVNFLDLNL